MRAVKERANAKINLFLDVRAKRPDGYHDINTVMHSVSLYDEVTVCVAPSANTSVSLRVVGNDRLVTDNKNLAVIAAKLYLERTAKTAAVSIKLVKNIPISAGLAGGSTDAAATLRAMNKLFDGYLSDRALRAMALDIGSDVPYCLFGRTAVCEGRGEIITPTYHPTLYTVIAAPNEYVSTPAAYSELDRIYSDFDRSVGRRGEQLYDKMLSALAEKRIDFSAVYNIFEDAVFPLCPRSAEIKAEMYRLGAVSAAMSGSGPSVYGIFESENAARIAADRLKNEGVSAYYAASV